MRGDGLKDRLDRLIEHTKGQFVAHNVEFWHIRDPWNMRVKHWVGDLIYPVLARLGKVHAHFDIERANWARGEINARMEGLEELYDLLDDEASKDLLVSLLAFRVVGPRHLRLPLNSESYWRKRASVPGMRRRKGTFHVGQRRLSLFEVPSGGEPESILMHNGRFGVLNGLLLDHYSLAREGCEIGVIPGDVVVDAGACWAEAALKFASLVGDEGKVYAFEFEPDNLEILKENLRLNPSLGARVQLVERPVWSRVGVEVKYDSSGPSTTIVEGHAGTGESAAVTTTIDQLVHEYELERVDFIKMDVEGAELPALRGAEATIRGHQPKLAISLYHSLDDFVGVPAWLRDLEVGYRFYLGHNTIFEHETVLFVTASCSGES